MADLVKLQAANAARWQDMKVNPGPTAAIDNVAKRLISGKSRYAAVSAQTGVPWAIIAVIHEREASGNWGASIAQGDPWNRVSVHVPKGRGPFSGWEAAAIDALVNCGPYASRWKDWSWGGALTLLEQYNGLGYANKGLPSPYIWASTDQYVKGKYVADNTFDPNAVDRQLGCAALLSRMSVLDPSANLAPAKAPAAPFPPPPDIKPTPAPAAPNWLSFLLSLFKRN